MPNDLDRFYSVLVELERRPNQGQRLAEYTGKSEWPAQGVYFFREPGELRAKQSGALRVVRVGTHGISANSKSTLWGRLRAHRGHGHGGGNHRGSVFRRHVGSALLGRDNAELSTWGKGASAARDIRMGEREHENLVSQYLGAMTVLWIDVRDTPGPNSARAIIERNAIALLSNRMNPVDRPSDAWLGNHSSDERIRRSGLLNLNHVDCAYDPQFLDLMESFCRRM